MEATLGHRRELCFWGWGYADDGLTAAEQSHVAQLAGQLGTGATPAAAPRLAEFDLPAPRVAAPDALTAILSSTPYDRITHVDAARQADSCTGGRRCDAVLACPGFGNDSFRAQALG